MPAPADRYTPVALKSGKFFILDYVDEQTGAASRKRPRFMQNKSHDRHRYRCSIVKEFFERYTDCEVVCVTLPGTAKAAERELERVLESELPTLSAGAFAGFYFDGQASGNGDDWAWRLSGPGKRDIDAYKFISRLKQAQLNGLVILDCQSPTRSQQKWPTSKGNIELLSRGERIQDESGKTVEDEIGFAGVVVSELALLVEGIDDEYRNWHAPISLPELIAKNYSLNSNPHSKRQGRPKSGSSEVIKRIKVCPDKIRQSGRVEFFSFTIQGSDEGEGEKQRGTGSETPAVDSGQLTEECEYTESIAADDTSAVIQGNRFVGDEGVELDYSESENENRLFQRP